MTVNNRKKNSRQRGSHTHGWGSKKKHRGSGHKGGVGMAGSGKRADSKKPSIWKMDYFGKRGFTSRKKNYITPINIWQIEEKLPLWLKENKAIKEEDIFVVDLEKLGYNKLLSTGIAHNKFRIITPYASANAVEKIKDAGGEVKGLISLNTQREKSD